MGRFGLNFWDALLLASAKRDGCTILYSDDFQHGRVYEMVEIVNPFTNPKVRSSN